MKKNITIILSLAFILLAGLKIYRYFFKSWAPYYQERLYQEPRPLLKKALEFYSKNSEKNKKALDLGAGAGNETAYLLQHGWQVWTNDNEAESIKIISSRTDVEPYKNNLVVMQKNFKDLPWNDLPQFQLIFAGYALPYAHPTDFYTVWQHLQDALQKDGIFAGHFFGPDHDVFNWWIKRRMTFLARNQIMDLFKNFTIEYFGEYNKKNEQGVQEHSFEVIARKR